MEYFPFFSYNFFASSMAFCKFSKSLSESKVNSSLITLLVVSSPKAFANNVFPQPFGP